jgi:hypothetical protein
MYEENRKENKIGKGYIEAACTQCKCNRGVFYNAVRNKKDGKPLTFIQLEVLTKYNELIEEAQRKLEKLK